MESSYVKHSVRLISNTQRISTSTFQLIGQLDEAIDSLSNIIDKKLNQVKLSSSSSSTVSTTSITSSSSPITSSASMTTINSTNQTILEDVKKLARVIEDLTEKKAQLAVKNYDLIDHNMKIIDHELNVIQKVKRSHPDYHNVDDGLSTDDATKGVIYQSYHDVHTIHDDSHSNLRSSSHDKRRKTETIEETFDVDPNEPVYCICRQIAYGDMVQCDDEECEIEWFHYPCVNLSKTPKSKWLCPACTIKHRH